MNLSNKQRAVDNTSLISAHETRLTSVEATKQDVLTELSDVRVGGLTSGSILNAGILHQSGAATFLGDVTHAGKTEYHNGGGQPKIFISGETGKIDAEALTYKKDGVVLDVETKIADLDGKLDSSLPILTSAIEGASRPYALKELLDQTLYTKMGLAQTVPEFTAVAGSLQPRITPLTDVAMAGLISTSVMNQGVLHQSGPATFMAPVSFNQGHNVTFSAGGGAETITIAPEDGRVTAKALTYMAGPSPVDVQTKMEQLEGKLLSTESILTSSLESAGQEYKLDELLQRVVVNKVKLETFVDELNGAVGDGNNGVVSLMEQVAANKGDLASESLARATGIADEVVARNAADVALNARLLAAEAVGVSNAAVSLASITAETNARVASDTGLRTDLDAQVAKYDARVLAVDAEIARVEAETANNLEAQKVRIQTALTTMVTAEQEQREASDVVLTDRISAAEILTASHIADVTASDALEVTARIAGDDALQTALDAHVVAYAARVASVDGSLSAVSKAKRDHFVIEGEGADPVFSCGSIPMEPDFGLPIISASELEKLSFICLTPDKSITGAHSMTLQVNVYGASSILLSSTPLTFTGRKFTHELLSPIAFPAGCNVVIKYASKNGTYHIDSRFRMVLQAHPLDLDMLQVAGY